MLPKVEVAIVGAGVVGLAIAYELSRYSDRTIVVLEKNRSFGMETSSRNSQVIHAGIYYPAPLLKTRLCIEGRQRLYHFCQKHRIAHNRLGKLIVACEAGESDQLRILWQQAGANGVELQPLSSREIQAMEPSVSAYAALYSPDSGIVDVHQLMQSLFHLGRENGVVFVFNSELTGVEYNGQVYTLTTNRDQFEAEWLINSSGLASDAIPEMLGLDLDRCHYRIHPCKGEYYRVKRTFPINHLIYPLPSTTGLLGIHMTPDTSGQLRLGPNAYDVPHIIYDLDDRHHDFFYQSTHSFLPNLQPDDIAPDFAGIRPRRHELSSPLQDFIITEESAQGLPCLINLVGIESPGLTSCLAIAAYVRGLMQ